MIEVYIKNPNSPYPFSFRILSAFGILAQSCGDFASIEDTLAAISELSAVVKALITPDGLVEVFDGEKEIHIPCGVDEDYEITIKKNIDECDSLSELLSQIQGKFGDE